VSDSERTIRYGEGVSFLPPEGARPRMRHDRDPLRQRSDSPRETCFFNRGLVKAAGPASCPSLRMKENRARSFSPPLTAGCGIVGREAARPLRYLSLVFGQRIKGRKGHAFFSLECLPFPPWEAPLLTARVLPSPVFVAGETGGHDHGLFFGILSVFLKGSVMRSRSLEASFLWVDSWW